MDLDRSFGFTLVITLAQLPGYAAAAVLVELWGRRPTLSLFLVGSAGSAVAFGLADGTTMMVAAGMALSFFNLGAWGALYAITSEIHPTLLRATGAGWAAGFGRIASILAPLSVPPLLKIGDNLLVFVVFAAFFLLAAAFAWGLPERRGEPLGRAGRSCSRPVLSTLLGHVTDASDRSARCWRLRPLRDSCGRVRRSRWRSHATP
jgi:putative MFS transporter